MEDKRRRDPNSATKMLDAPPRDVRETRVDARRQRGGVASSPDSRGETPPARAVDRDRYSAIKQLLSFAQDFDYCSRCSI